MFYRVFKACEMMILVSVFVFPDKIGLIKFIKLNKVTTFVLQWFPKSHLGL